MEFLQWLSDVGTNEWISNFVSNNNLILSGLGLGGGVGIKKWWDNRGN